MRKFFFWLHLMCGTAAALVILTMSVTGVLLMYERQVIEWADRNFRSSVAAAPRLSPEELVERTRSREGSIPASLTLRFEPDAPVEVGYPGRVIYLDAYSGEVLGEGSARVRNFFRTVTIWHRWLAMDGDSRPIGKAITGASNLIFLFLALSGMYIWLPRSWAWKQVRAVIWFRRGLSGKARDFNWHNAIGIWCAVPLVVVICGAMVISYPWATSFVVWLGGDTPAAPRPAQEASAGQSIGLNQAWRQAEAAVPGWQSITWRPGNGDTISLAIAGSHRGRVDLRSTMVVNQATGAVEHQTFEKLGRGRQWRMWLRFLHTGEALGVAGQTIAGIVSLGGAFLVWTGLALAWRRFRAWRARRTTAPRESVPELTETSV
ncbi:MAG: PepSY-associated TM helix domain-containing protein [Bryobacteraceae bacterium]